MQTLSTVGLLVEGSLRTLEIYSSNPAISNVYLVSTAPIKTIKKKKVQKWPYYKILTNSL